MISSTRLRANPKLASATSVAVEDPITKVPMQASDLASDKWKNAADLINSERNGSVLPSVDTRPDETSVS